MLTEHEREMLKDLDESQKVMSGNGAKEDFRIQLQEKLWRGKSALDLLNQPHREIHVERACRTGGPHSSSGYRAVLTSEINDYEHTFIAEYDPLQDEITIKNGIKQKEDCFFPGESYEKETSPTVTSSDDLVEKLDKNYYAEIRT